MAQSNGIPAAHRPLFALRAVTDVDPGNAGPEAVTEPVTGPVTLPSVPPGVTGNAEASAVIVPMRPAERAGNAVRHWSAGAANGAGQLWLRPGRVLYVLWHGRPETMAEHRAYVKSRAWVPRELSGKPAAVIAAAGISYHLLIARPVKGAARIVDAAAERPLRLLILAALVSVLVFIVPHL